MVNNTINLINGCTKILKQIFKINNIEIVLKQPGVSLESHLDREHRDYASITYLNSLESGYTNIENFGDIKPEKGRTIFFKGNKMKHGNRNPEKDRYTFISLGEVIGSGTSKDLKSDDIRRLMAGGAEVGDLAKELA